MNANSPRTALAPGVALALFSALLFGASMPLAKLFLAEVDPGLLAGIFYLGSGLGLGALLLGRRLRGSGGAEAPLTRRDMPWLCLVILAGGVVGPLLAMLGLARIAASSASLLLNLEGLATMAIAWMVFRENADARILAGALAILAGAALLAWPGSGIEAGWGAVFIAGACLAWGIDNNLTRKLSAADPVQIAMAKGLAAGPVNLAIALSQGAVLPQPRLLAEAATVGFFGNGLSLVLFVLALRHLGTARTSAYFSLAPFIGASLAIPLFGETPPPALFGAALLMGIGLYLHLRERHEHNHIHAPGAHAHRHVHDVHHQHAHDPGDAPGEPHTHEHRHEKLRHLHPHFPDIHHRHGHSH